MHNQLEFSKSRHIDIRHYSEKSLDIISYPSWKSYKPYISNMTLSVDGG